MADRVAALRTWRPQRFGRRAARHIEDPVVEPLWSGIRALAWVSADRADLVDPDGGALEWPEVADALRDALRADSLVVDGYLTAQATGSGVGAGADGLTQAPSSGQMARQMLWFGSGDRDRRGELVEALEAARTPTFAPVDSVGFVAVDLLEMDGEPLLDVPLLERKRLLESTLEEGLLVRRTAHVRPPVDIWFGTWRSLGFRSVAYKAANSRYRPGEPNEDWATSEIPRR